MCAVQCLAFPGNYVTTGACKQLDLQILYLEQIQSFIEASCKEDPGTRMKLNTLKGSLGKKIDEKVTYLKRHQSMHNEIKTLHVSGSYRKSNTHNKTDKYMEGK